MNSITLARTLPLLALLSPAAPAQVTYTPVGLTGLVAPGNVNGAQFSSFAEATLNARGQTAFGATLQGLGVGNQNNVAIWAGALPPGVAARENNRPPGTASGVQFDSFGDPVLGEGGHVGFYGTLRGLGVGGQNNAGIWSGLPEAVQLAARKGSVPPGIGNASVQFSTLGSPAIDRSGAIAFYGTMIGLGIGEFNDAGIWAGAPGSLRLVARTGDVPPGIGNASVQFLALGTPTIGSSANVAFNATVIGLGIGEQNDTGIWAGPAGALTLAAREGSRPPGTSSGVMFNSFDEVVNAGNQIGFGATLIGLGVGDQNDSGIWAGAPGALRLVAREGNVPPGIANAGVQFDSFGPPTLSAGGQVAFQAILRGAVNRETREGIWSGPASAPTLVARAGNPAPDTGDDVNFLSFGDPVFTGAGTVAFYAKLIGLDVGPQNDAGIWAADSGGQLHLIVREGGFLNGGDVPREISPDGLNLFPRQGGNATSPGTNVQVLFQATFIDGTNGLFVGTLGAPRIDSITPSESGGLQIQFTGVSGLAYAIEFTTDVGGGKWETLSSPILGSGRPITVTDNLTSGQPARVYRLRVLPGR